MKKAGKGRTTSEMLPVYDFRGGVRGRYVARLKVSQQPDTAELLHVLAPLVGFRWSGKECRITDDTWIRPRSMCQDWEKFSEFKHFLSDQELNECREVEHWLTIIHARSDFLSVKEKMNSFLMALWIVRPTQTYVPLRFEMAESFRSAARVLDRFRSIEGQFFDEIEDEHLEVVRGILGPLRAIYSIGSRLRNALVLTFRGCVASAWQPAFICFAAAAETLLTYSREPGITDRLAESYAKLITTSRTGRESAKDHFRRLYSVRSDIIHGRAYDRKDPRGNLANLTEFSDILRQLWRIVLESAKVRAALEGDDRHRQNFLLKL